MSLKKVSTVALVLALAGAAGAQTQLEMNGQALRDFSRADAALNAQYKATRAFMVKVYANPQSRNFISAAERGVQSYEATLLASQRAWLRFRDAQCAVENYQSIGGTIHGLAVTMCKTDLTRQRTKQLKLLQSTDPNPR